MYSKHAGTTAIPGANIFEQVVCGDDEQTSSGMKEQQVQWRESFLGQDAVSSHERLVRMAKAGIEQGAIVSTLKRLGLSQHQIEEYLPLILKEAQARLEDDDSVELEKETSAEDSTQGRRKGTLKDTVYYSMLKAGLSPGVVRQRMIVVAQMEPASADRLVQSLCREIENDGLAIPNYDY